MKLLLEESIQTIKADVYLKKSYLKGSMVMDSVFQLQRAQLLITSH